MKKVLLLGFFTMTFIFGVAVANPVFYDSVQTDASITAATYQQLLRPSNQGNEAYSKLFGNKEGSMIKVNMACGFPPFPPFGCRVGPCMCNKNGANCQWTFICK